MKDLEYLMDFKKFYFLFIALAFASCSPKNQGIKAIYPEKIAKLDGRHAVFLNNKNMKITKNIKSEDCESWRFNAPNDDLLYDSYYKLLTDMFSEVEFLDKKLTKDEIEERNFKSLIEFNEIVSVANFITERNTGKFQIQFTSSILVKSNDKKVKNFVKSEQKWQKNIYLNCHLHDGGTRASEEALKVLLQQSHENIYESVYNVTR